MRERLMCFSKQIHTTLNQAPRKTHFEDQAWMNNDQKKLSNGRRSAPLAQHHPELQLNKQPMYNYPPQHPRNGQQRNLDSSPNRQHRTFVLLSQITQMYFFSFYRRSPTRPTMSTHNDRVLSVSGKLRCSRCNDELGKDFY